MSDTKYTPGPWITVHDHDKNFVEPQSPTPNEDYIAYCSGQGDFGVEVAAANARLIAAAPEMLNALKGTLKVLEILSNRKIDIEASEYLLDKVHAAVKKAEGEQ